MSNFKLRALAGASAIAALSGLALQANATTIHGGGSTLLQPYFAQSNESDFAVEALRVSFIRVRAIRVS